MKSPQVIVLAALIALAQTTSWAKVQPILPAESAGAVLRRIGCTVDTILDKSCSILDISQTTQDIATSILDNSYSILDISQTTQDIATTILDKSCSILDISQTTQDIANTILDTSYSILDISQTTQDIANTILDTSYSILDISQTTQGIATTILDTSYSILDKSCSTLDILIALGQCSSSAITAPTTISAAGVYCLANAINGTIAVNASDVLLDLNNHAITNTGSPAITIGAYQNIILRNGTIRVIGADAVTATSTTALMLNHLLISNAARGFYGTQIMRGHIAQCDFMSNSTGLEIDASVNLVIDQCTAANNSSAGFSLINSTNNCVQNSKALNNGSTASGDAFGFVSTNGSGNMFTGCLADGTQTATTNFCTVAAGFALLGTEQCSKIVDCSACNAFSPYITGIVGTGTQTQTAVYSARPHGILLESISNKTLIQIASIAPGIINDTIFSVNWSPDGKYLAVGGVIDPFGSTNDLFVYQFNPSSSTPLIEIASIAPGSTGDTIFSVNWSGDGTYLAVGGSIAGNDLFVYQFDPSSSTPLIEIASITPGGAQNDSIESINWSPDGKYLAVGGIINPSGSTNDLFVYQFDPSAPLVNRLVQIASIAPGSISDQIFSVNWSPDGTYLAVGGFIDGTPGNDLRVYQFDPSSSTPLVQIASIAPGGSTDDIILSVNWSPDGKYLAVGGVIDGTPGNDLIVYQFDPSSSTPLVQIASITPGGAQNDSIESINWSPDGKYLAVGGIINPSGSTNDLFVYQFDPSSSTPLIEIASIAPGGSTGNFVQSVNWSPDGKYLAVGGFIDLSGSTNDLFVYQFDPSAPLVNRLVQIASIAPGTTDDIIRSVNWSPDGKYLAVGGRIFGTPGNDLIVYQFDPSSSTPLVPIASIAPGSIDDIIRSVNWSPDGKYLAVGGRINPLGLTNDLIVYQFDPSSSTPLEPIASIAPGSTGDEIFSVNWSPDGTYLAVGGIISGFPGNDLRVYQFKQNFPTKNFIQNNTATCNMTTSTQCPRGTGISGSSIQNCIFGNTAYNNPFNYTFVTNVHSQLLNGNTNPSSLQNVSLIGCQPICMPNELDCVAITTATIDTKINCLDLLIRQLLTAQSITATC